MTGRSQSRLIVRPLHVPLERKSLPYPHLPMEKRRGKTWQHPIKAYKNSAQPNPRWIWARWTRRDKASPETKWEVNEITSWKFITNDSVKCSLYYIITCLILWNLKLVFSILANCIWPQYHFYQIISLFIPTERKHEKTRKKMKTRFFSLPSSFLSYKPATGKLRIAALASAKPLGAKWHLGRQRLVPPLSGWKTYQPPTTGSF